MLFTIFSEILFAKIVQVLMSVVPNQLILVKWTTTFFDRFLTQSYPRLQKPSVWWLFLVFFVLFGAWHGKPWTVVVWQEPGEDLSKIWVQSTRGWVNNLNFFGCTVPLTCSALQGISPLASSEMNLSLWFPLTALFKVGHVWRSLIAVSPSLLSLKEFLILPFPLSEAADCVTSVTSFFCFSPRSLPLAQSVLAVVRKIQQMMDVFTLGEHFHGCTQSHHYNSTVFTEILPSSSSSSRVSFPNRMHKY